MRIGLITPGFSASEADWCVPALLDLVRTLASRHDVEVFALRYPHSKTTYQVYGAQVHPIGGGQRGGLARLSILAQTWRQIQRRQAQQRPFDVLHALWAHEPGFLAALAGRHLGVPVVVSILGGELADLPEIDYGGERSRANRWLAARALAGADQVTVGSRWLWDQVVERIPGDKLQLQPLGFETERFRRAASGPKMAGSPKLLHVASFSPVKDQRILLEAFAAVLEHFPGARLHLVGAGMDCPEMTVWLSELGLDGRVHLHGSVDHEALASYYQQADLLIQSSRFESQGMAVLEAVAAGCPVVGTAVGVLPEISPNENLAPPGECDTLAAIVRGVLADPLHRERLRAAQADALGRFEVGHTVNRWIEHYIRLTTSTLVSKGTQKSR